MANPFSGTITGKNTGHTNQANLLYAVIPRSTSSIVEVINSYTMSLAGAAVGSYDSDGYLIGGDAGATTYIYKTGVAAFDFTSSFTIIAGIKYLGGGSGGDTYGGIYHASDGSKRILLHPDVFAQRGRPDVTDGSLQFLTAYSDFASAHTGMALKSTAGAQSSGYITGASSPPSGTYTSIGTDNETFNFTADMTQLTFATTAAWGWQYLFVYNDDLSDADIEAIIENPGGVLSFSGGSTKPAAYYAQL
jgi:hypothetical protein